MYSEQAVINFYEWELTGRGYYIFPYQIDIEPPFKPFYHSYSDNKEYVDDGKAPTFFEKLFSKKKIVGEKIEDEEEFIPKNFEYSESLKQIKISFPLNFDFKNLKAFEFLNMLSESEGQISFEIIGEFNSVEIQIVCTKWDHYRILHLLYAYFPNSIIRLKDIEELPFDINNEILIADFGYDEEFMRPINFSVDPVIGIMAVLEKLRNNEVVLFQAIFKGVKNSWANSILRSVSIGSNSFFPESPEMLSCAKEKTSSPLFAVIIRLAVQAENPLISEKLANELILNVRSSSKSEFNSLIPLSNEGYEYGYHLENLFLRGTNRFGMIMDSQELQSFIHFPESQKLINSELKTKVAPNSVTNNEYLIGINEHLGVEKEVTLNDSQRLRHCHIIGATGTGKSTFISSLFLEDIKKGNGCAIFDPHGDTIEDIIPHIPQNRLNDVILLDPSDNEYSFGFNLLSAKTEVEKIVLSSDLVEAFKRHSTSWGDQMTSVLSNAINAFLNSNTGGTLIELKRFILENSYRKEFLQTVDDPSIHYYWNNEFNLSRRANLSPLLTRIDTFLRPKTIRYILSQKRGLDFNTAVNGNKIILVKLSQGLIGEDNSYLLGTLILAKIYQVAQARQSLAKTERHPFYIYLDEFQNFITPSINSILSGARKYGIGLVLAHQELNQIKDADISNSVLSNANIRICFRLGDFDAKKLESGFSYFDSNDLQNLNIGQAIVKVGKSTNDFSLGTFPLKTIQENENRNIIIENARNNYSQRIDEIEDNLNKLFPDFKRTEPIKVVEERKKTKEIPKKETDIKKTGQKYLEKFEEKETIREHRYLQTFIKKIAEQRGFKATIEETVELGRVDVSLLKGEIKIACEIAISNSVDYEVKNITKCIDAGYKYICVISRDIRHLINIKNKAIEDVKDVANVKYFNPNEIAGFLNSIDTNRENRTERIRGYRVKVNFNTIEKYNKF